MGRLATIIIFGFSIFFYSASFCYGSDICSKEGDLIRSYLNEERLDGYFIVGENEKRALVIENNFTSEQGLSLAYIDEAKIVKRPLSPPHFPAEKIFLERCHTNLLIAHNEPFFNEGLGVVRLYSSRLVVIDHTGKFAIEPELLARYSSIGNFREGRAVFYIYDKLIPEEEFRAKLTNLSEEDRKKKGILTSEIGQSKKLAVQRSLITGCIDTSGKKIFSNTEYGEMHHYSEHMALIRMKGQNKFGFIGWDGHLAIPARFNSASDFHDGLALVKQGEIYGFIDYSGKFVINPKFKNAHSFSEGLVAVQIDGKWGYINHKGQVVITPTFKWAGDFSEGLAPASLECEQDRDKIFDVSLNSEKCHYGFIDRSGKFKLPPRFIRVFPFRFGIAKVWEPADIATKTFFFAAGFVVPAQTPIVERYIDKNGKYLQSYRKLI